MSVSKARGFLSEARHDTYYKGLVCDTEHNNALHYPACHYAECRVLFIFMRTVIMLSVVILNIVMLSDVALLCSNLLGPML